MRPNCPTLICAGENELDELGCLHQPKKRIRRDWISEPVVRCSSISCIDIITIRKPGLKRNYLLCAAVRSTAIPLRHHLKGLSSSGKGGQQAPVMPARRFSRTDLRFAQRLPTSADESNFSVLSDRVSKTKTELFVTMSRVQIRGS